MQVNPMNPIEAAVMPLKVDAIEQARVYALKQVETVESNLAAVGWDINQAAPSPNASVGRYFLQLAKYTLYKDVTEWLTTSIRHGLPCYVRMSPKKIERYIEGMQERAAEAYDLYVEKLVMKIGEVKSAELKGSHIWGESYLTVVKADSSIEVWKSKTIYNTSKLGKVFPQYPTRKVGPRSGTPLGK